MAPEIVHMHVNLDLDGDYERLIQLLRETLADHPQQRKYIKEHGDWLINHPLLPKQVHSEQPARWMHIHLAARDKKSGKDMRTTIAVRDDNVYLIGFSNLNGKWYEFGIEGSSAKFIEGSTFLGCDASYGAMFRRSGNNLVNLSVGKYTAIDAVRSLSGYEQDVPADKATRVDLARMCVMICEAARMVPHFDIVRGGWNDIGSRMTGQHERLTKNWRRMSRSLLSGRHSSPAERERLLAAVHLLLNSPGFSQGIEERLQELLLTPGAGGSSEQGPGSSNPAKPETSSWQPASGDSGDGAQEQKGQTGDDKSVRTKPLLEVFSVRTTNPDGIDRIIVFDGKRGQIIYKHGRRHPSRFSSSEYMNQLALTGPYKAISAEGSFAIQVHGITSGTDASDDESSNSVIGEMSWDCYADDVEYDKVLTRDIISTGTSQHTLAEVRYAVRSDAVEATVEVNLLLPAGIIHVHGEISAHCQSFLNYEPVLYLFARGRDEKVELVPSGGADSMAPLELARSVIAVPVLTRYSCQWIRVLLHVAHPNGEDDVLLVGNIFFYFDKHTGEIRLGQDGDSDSFLPVDWAGVSDPNSSSSQGAASSPGGQGTAEQTSEQQVKVQVNISSPGFHLSPLKPDRGWYTTGVSY